MDSSSEEEERGQEEPGEKFDLSKIFTLNSQKDVKPTVKKLREDEISIVEKLVKKHGDDTSKMFRDIKINYEQWTAGVIKKKLASYEHFGNAAAQA